MDAAGIIYSYANVSVGGVIKGSISMGQVITIRYTGGTVGDTTMMETVMHQITPDSFMCISGPDFYEKEKVTLCLKDCVGIFDVLGGYMRVIGGDIQSTLGTEYGYIYEGYNWKSMPVSYYINQDGTADTTNEFTAIQNAFQTWENDVGSYIDFEYMGTTTKTPLNKDNVNVVGWLAKLPEKHGAAPAMVRMWTPKGSKNLVECDMAFNDTYLWGTGGETNRMDVQNVATHEAGHFLSLDDLDGTEDSKQTMYAYASLGETKKRSLEWGDLAGVRRIYPHTHKKEGWVGHESQGGDVAFYDINGNGVQDVVMVWVDNPPGENTIRYHIGWDVSSVNGKASSWSSIKTKPDWVGHGTHGVGIAFAYIDAGTTPDMVLTWVDIPSGENKISYHIGWNVNTAGDPSSWSSIKTKPGWVGHETQGVAITFAYIDAGTTPDMVLTWVDNPPGENKISYHIGWNVNTAGDPSSWSSIKKKPDWVGHGTQDAGVTILDLDLNGKNDIVLMWVDIPSGENKIVYHIGWDITTAGDVSSTRDWSRIFKVGGWVGHETQGGGLSFAHIDGDGRPDLGIMWIDNPGGENSVNYRYV
jgi:hypothetical protein